MTARFGVTYQDPTCFTTLRLFNFIQCWKMRTPDKKIFLAYFEKGCPRSQIRAALPLSEYRAQWFDPRAGTWRDAGNLQSSSTGIMELPDFPTDLDWGLRLEYAGPASKHAAP